MAEATISVLPSVQAALLAQLTTAMGQSSLSTTQVTPSHPGEGLQPSAMYLGEAIATELIPVSRGGGRVVRQESWRQDVYASVSREGDFATAATTDAFTLYAVLENVLATNPTLGVDGVIKVTPIEVHCKIAFSGTRSGWDCVLKIVIGIESRLY